jgi:hypothetical protein
MQTRQEFCLNLELIKLTELPRCVYFQTVTGGIRSEYVVPKVFLICSATDIRKSATFKQVLTMVKCRTT